MQLPQIVDSILRLCQTEKGEGLRIHFSRLMSSGRLMLRLVTLLSLRLTGQLGQPRIQSSPVGICGAQCLFSPFWSGDGLFQKPSSESRHPGTDCSGYTL